MTVFKYFFKISGKYIANLIMYTCIFLGITITLTKVNSQPTIENYSAKKLDVAIYNHSDSEIAAALTDYITENHNILLDIDEDLDAFRDEIYNRNVDYILIIPEDFEETLTVEAYKLPGSVSSIFMDNSINSFIKVYSSYVAIGYDKTEAYEKTISTVNTSVEVTMDDNSKATTYDTAYYFYNYIPYVFTCIICLGISPILIVFNKPDIRKKIQCSGVSVVQKNISLSAGCVIYGLGIVLFYIIVAIIMYGPGNIFTARGLLRILNTLIFAITTVSLSFLLSSLTGNANVVNMFVNAYGLGSSFLCGVFVQRAYLADGVKALGKLFPSSWYIDVEEAALNFTGSFNSKILTGLGVQLLFAIAFMVVAITISSRKTKD